MKLHKSNFLKLRKASSLPHLCRWLVVIIVLAAIYYGAAKLGMSLSLPIPPGNVTPMWPPSAIAWAAVLLLGYRVWFGIWLGDFFANTPAYIDTSHNIVNSMLVGGMSASSGTIEAVLGAFLIQRWIKSRYPFARSGNVFLFILIALLSPALSATSGSLGMCLGGIAEWAHYGSLWYTWWIGNGISVLVITPMLLTWQQRPWIRFKPKPWHLAEALLLLMTLLGVSYLSFEQGYPVAYMLIPCLVWATFRFGQYGATTGVVIVSSLAVWGTSHGVGSFMRQSLNESLLLLQSFMGVIAVTTLVLMAVLAERQRSDAALVRANEQLEIKVEKRTAALQQVNKELSAEIAERQQAENLLRQSEQRYQTLAEASPIGVFYSDAQGDCLYINRRWSEIAGLIPTQALGKNWSRALHPEDRERIVTEWYQAVLTKQPFHSEYRFQRCDDKITWVIGQALPIKEEDGNVIAYVGTITDITERKQAEEALRRSEGALRKQTIQLEKAFQELQQTQSQLIQSEKMSSLGQLVAGVAHEINNPVNFIYGNLMHIGNYAHNLLDLSNLYQQHYPNTDPEIEEFINEIELNFMREDLPKTLSSMEIGANRIREIILTLRNFSRLDEAEMKPVNIHEGIDSTIVILQHRWKAKPDSAGIEIVKEYGNLPEVECYPGQLNQVFMNILSNAIDALQQQEANYSPEEMQQNPSRIHIRTQVQNSGWVTISIKDNGPGITEAVKTRLFDPFFTTKPIGKGTGLGLSISYQIVVDKHGGKIECLSELGKGTEFLIKIPIQQMIRKNATCERDLITHE